MNCFKISIIFSSDTSFGLLSKCFLSEKIVFEAATKSCFRPILSNSNFLVILSNRFVNIDELNLWAANVVNAKAWPWLYPSFEKTYDKAWPNVVELFPNPNPVTSDPKANFSNLSFNNASSNMLNAVLQRNFV